jgi:hypothetical protein
MIFKKTYEETEITEDDHFSYCSGHYTEQSGHYTNVEFTFDLEKKDYDYIHENELENEEDITEFIQDTFLEEYPDIQDIEINYKNKTICGWYK